jgi:WD40 repeat protein/DNA-binding SARP family transcriptional activator
MGIAVLGPLRLDGQLNHLSPRDRVVLSAMVVRGGEPTSAETLAQALWGEALPASWAKVVQGCVARLRKRLGAAAIESGPWGYRLALTGDEVDSRRFERLLTQAREVLDSGDAARAAHLAGEALGLWRGGALGDVEEWEPGRVEALRLEGLRQDAEELLVEAEIRAGRAATVLDKARLLVAQAPFRERRWALLARALNQVGRQADALQTVNRARSMLVDELGLDPGPELTELEVLLLRQDRTLTAPSSRRVSPVCPYPGLLAYGTDDADTYFGRERDVQACLRRLRDSGVLAVVGPSGLGKSSLVRAGVAASLLRAGRPLLVTTPGSRPLDTLAGLSPRQTLVVDQAEEVVTLCTDPRLRAAYLAALAGHVSAGGPLVLSLRSDHLGDLAPYPEITRVIEEGLYLVAPMSEPDLRSAIEGPARRAGLRLEPGLADLLVREVEGEPAALPMLSHVLRETWLRREGPTLTVAGYRATGGIRHAVAQSAEDLYEAMDETRRRLLRGLLLRLVASSDDGGAVPARLARTKVAADAAYVELVERLVDARLVTIDEETVQIAHEALVQVWPRFRGWLDDDVEGQRLFRHLAGAADAWDAMGRPDSELYRGARLSRVLEWRDRTAPDLDEVETEFLAASEALSESELRSAEARVRRERRTNRRLRGSLAGLGVLLVLALVAGVLAVDSAHQAGRERNRAERAANLADAGRAGAQSEVNESVATALLLSVAALQVDHGSQAWDNLGSALTRAGALSRVRDIGTFPVWLTASRRAGLVATSSPGKGVQLFDSATLEPVPFADNTPSSVIEFSPDGRQLATAVNQWTGNAEPRIDDRPVRLYDVPSGRMSERQPGGLPPNSSVEYAMKFSRDGSRLTAVVQHYRGFARWSPNGRATVWDVAEPSRPVFRAPVPEYAVVALSPDGDRLFVAMQAPRPLRVYDVDSRRLLHWTNDEDLAREGTSAIEVSPDGQTLRRRGAALHGHTATVSTLRYSGDGRLLVSASEDRSAVVWDAAAGHALHRFVGDASALNGTAFGSGTRLFTVGGQGHLSAWDFAGGDRLLTLGENAEAGVDAPYFLTLPAPDGHTVASLRSGRLWFEDTRTGRRVTGPDAVLPARQLGTVPPDAAQQFAWSPDSRTLLSGGTDGVLRKWDPRSGRLLGSAAFPAGTDLLPAFGGDSDSAYVQGFSSELVKVKLPSMRAVHTRTYLGLDVYDLLVSHDNAVVVSLEGDGSFQWLRPGLDELPTDTRHELIAAEGPPGALSADGSRLAAIDSHGDMRLFDVRSFEPSGNDTTPTLESGLVYAPDGSQVAAVQPGRIRLWDGRTGDYQASLPLPSLTSQVSIAYLPDSSGLLVAGTNGSTWTVDTRTSRWVDRACAIGGRNLTRSEWREYFPNRDYRVTCPEWPARF